MKRRGGKKRVRDERRRDETGELLARSDASLLELVDHVLNKGVVVQGEAILGVAGVDLVYLRLSAVLCAADRVFRDVPRRPR